MTIGSGDAVARVAAIQQMAAALNLGPAAAKPVGDGASFSAALDQAQTAGGTQAIKAAGDVTGIPYADQINAAAKRHGIDPSLLAGLVKQESGFNPGATSPVGAKGLTQLMPATARSLGVTDSSDPAQALEGGAKYLKQMLDKFGGDPRLALAAYNAGPGAVSRFGGIPPYAETKNYVEKVMANRDAFAAAITPSPTAVGAATTVPAASPIDSSSSAGSYGSGSSLGYPTT